MKNPFELKNFFSPPNEYGIVSFYWWVGEEITKDRLLWQLDRLAGMDICGLQINYCHTDSGGRIYGLPFEGAPKQFSDDWWEIFGWFLQECEKRDISVSLSDYTLGTPGQGYYTDEILRSCPQLCGGKLSCETKTLHPGETAKIHPDCRRVACFAYPVTEAGVDGRSGIDLSAQSEFTADTTCILTDILCIKEPYSLDPMHKDSGAEVIDKFFNRFEGHNPGQCGKALNFFFSDELNFGIGGNLWNDTFAEEFTRRKGYDIIPHLYGIFADIGPITQKIRLDYYDVIVQLEEENYFAPVYDWHEERGMTYGCDHGGRGYDVTEFGDYFRTQKYNQGPGNDQSNLGHDIIKNKVSASIAHLYDRPRTWLEGFHSSGWSMGTAELCEAICRNFAMGHNLLSLHGLYYTTYGGFWEWAPPCNHFRMPYWRHMKKLTECVKRMSYLNTRGLHACDVAILYPVAAMEGGLDGEKAVSTAFSLGETLYKNGVDFDFLDFQSLLRGKIDGGEMKIAGKAFRTIILPSMKTVRFACLEKLLAFKKSGGQVLCVGDLPIASDRAGRDDDVLDDLVAQLFDSTLPDPAAVMAAMDARYSRDFRVLDCADEPYFMHRKLEIGELYSVYGLPKGTHCHFRTTGQPILLDPLDKKIYRLQDFDAKDDGTTLSLPLPSTRPQYILFTDSPLFAKYPALNTCDTYEPLPLKDTWQSRLCPTMDNTYGDFAQPAENRLIGAQIRKAEIDGVQTTLGYGTYFKLYGPVANLSAETEQKLLCDPENAGVEFKDYGFSMRYGAEGDPGHQGWHGLKKKVTDAYLTLGRRVDHHHEYRYEPEIAGGCYYFYTYVYAETAQAAEILTGEMKPAALYLNGQPAGEKVDLRKGYNLLAMKFDRTGRTYVMVQKAAATPFIQTVPLAMNWYKNPNILPFDADCGERRSTTVRFFTPPGCATLHLPTNAPLTATFDGVPAVIRPDGEGVILENPTPNPNPAVVVITLQNTRGQSGGGLFDGYIDATCGEGIIRTGDWGETDGLSAYSGGMCYGQTFVLPPDAMGKKVTLSLGDVVATAEVTVNGKSAGVLVCPPYEIDIGDYVTVGENLLEVTVCNTLYNHYTTIPTKYNPPQRSGLMGPVEVRLSNR